MTGGGRNEASDIMRKACAPARAMVFTLRPLGARGNFPSKPSAPCGRCDLTHSDFDISYVLNHMVREIIFYLGCINELCKKTIGCY